MKNEVLVLPIEVNELAKQVSNDKQEEVLNVLTQIFTGTDEWEKQVDAIEVKGIDDKMSIELADVARKNAKSARLNAEKIFDAKRLAVQNIKAEYDLEDKLWLKSKQVMQLKFKAIEDKAEWKANFVKRYEAEQKELRTQNRILQVEKYAEINRIEFENMSDESFESFVNGLKSTYLAKIEAERLAEEKRLATLKAEADRIEAQRVENERLKIEADKREKEIEEERKKAQSAELERQRLAKIEADKQMRIQAEKDVEIEKERQARIKLENENKAKEDARIKAELDAKKEADKLAKAPIKNQLAVWVDSFNLPNSSVNNETSDEIKAKFESFKKWSINLIEQL